VTATLNIACNILLELVSEEQHHYHTCHQIVCSDGCSAKYLSSCTEQTFNSSRAGQSRVCLDKSFFNCWIWSQTVSGSVAAGQILGQLIAGCG